MTNFNFSVQDLMSTAPDPFTREITKGLPHGQKSLSTSGSFSQTKTFNPSVGSSLLSVSEMMMGSPMIQPQTQIVNQMQSVLGNIIPQSISQIPGAKSLQGQYAKLVPGSSDPIWKSGIQSVPSSAGGGGSTTGAASAAGSGAAAEIAASTLSTSGKLKASQIIALASSFIGKAAYVWGAENPGPPAQFDCSGFIQYVYGQAGVITARNTQVMWDAGPLVPNAHVSVLIPSDILLLGSSPSSVTHGGLYYGNSQMIACDGSGDTGPGVEVTAVSDIGQLWLNTADYFLGAIRLLQ